MTLVVLEWLQESGRLPSDAAFLAALSAAGWLELKRREERRLRSLYGDDYMAALGLRLQAMGLDLAVRRVATRPFVRGG